MPSREDTASEAQTPSYTRSKKERRNGVGCTGKKGLLDTQKAQIELLSRLMSATETLTTKEELESI